ncbi:flippase [Rouxiella badensis]|jgi:O-antigen/teichoic acid export membrane protein|uniref:Flippase n=1 Tax=Rouxiella badensis TaxID=1646377 RepID=A0A1X0WHY8_9GAMM|nr:flippase [Rouxiella badensis]MCC3703436.1 flippase [Rouxiella badensis]MCC3718375.1 flippase [Rouxiella badensis]MCC3726857.1 flippase [Rouxiella badensis]MCC3731859.1 flippase [Rouxiella badensis]MCC3738794.1 flippase [Rouxiella badensis]
MKQYISKIFSSGFIRNISWNLLGYALPVLVAIVMIPVVMKHTGLERFGVLTLIIVLIGSMTVFDFGITRSVTNSVRKYLDEKNERAMLTVVKTGWLMITCVLLVISVLFWVESRWIAEHFFNVSNQQIREEIAGSMKIVAFSLPFVIAQTIFVGVMEAFGAFKKISIGKAPFSILMYLVPMIISFFTPSLFYITLSLCILRCIMAVAFYLMMRSEIKTVTPISLMSVPTTKAIALELVRYGGWVSVGNIIAPIMLYIDRFFVASIVGATVFAYYTTPYDVVSRIAIVAVSVCGVLFPMLVTKIATDIRSANAYFNKVMLGIFAILVIPAVAGIFLSKWFLSVWINPGFAEHSWIIFSMFLAGYLVHGLVQPAFVWIQACGKPWIIAMCEIVDLALYVIYLPWMTHHYGIIGAAIAWNFRMLLSLVVLHTLRYVLYSRELKRSRLVVSTLS